MMEPGSGVKANSGNCGMMKVTSLLGWAAKEFGAQDLFVLEAHHTAASNSVFSQAVCLNAK